MILSVLCSIRFRPLFLDLAKTDESKLAVLRAVAEFYTNNPQVPTYVHTAVSSRDLSLPRCIEEDRD